MVALHCLRAVWCSVHRHDVGDARCRVFTSGRRRRLSFVRDGNSGRNSDTDAGAHTCAGRRHAGTSPTGRQHLWRPE
jgi:hypothetical protein